MLAHEDFQSSEGANVVTLHAARPPAGFLAHINRIRRLEQQRRLVDDEYRHRVNVS